MLFFSLYCKSHFSVIQLIQNKTFFAHGKSIVFLKLLYSIIICNNKYAKIIINCVQLNQILSFLSLIIIPFKRFTCINSKSIILMKKQFCNTLFIRQFSNNISTNWNIHHTLLIRSIWCNTRIMVTVRMLCACVVPSYKWVSSVPI